MTAVAILNQNPKERVSVIIPAYNEEPRIGAVLSAVSSSDLVDEIIVVDDSTDKTSQVARSFSKVKVIRNQRNLGKTQAVLKGAKAAQREIILLLDADIANLKTEGVEAMIVPVLEDRADMTISYRMGQPFFNKYIIWAQPFVSGERCLHKGDFLKIEGLNRAEGFELEVLCNHDYLKKKRRIVIVTLEDVCDPFKYQKYSFVQGWTRDLTMCFNLVTRFGLMEIFKQMFLICLRFQVIRLTQNTNLKPVALYLDHVTSGL